MTLITKLEAATGADRALANEVLLACGWTEWEQEPGMVWLSPPRSQSMYLRGHVTCPDPTSSIDSALSLVPEGYMPNLNTSRRDGVTWYGWHIWKPTDRSQIESCHKSMAIALCIAALRARMVGT